MQTDHDSIASILLRVLGLALVCLCGVLLWPVDVLELRRFPPQSEADGERLLSISVAPGQELRTRMIHSVQQTPVEDVYRIQEGRLWSWQERVLSHSAGLPSLPPARGRFFHAAPWMVFEGRGLVAPFLVYRVGTKALGRNTCLWPSGQELPLWRDHPGERLLFRVVRLPLYQANRMNASSILVKLYCGRSRENHSLLWRSPKGGSAP